MKPNGPRSGWLIAAALAVLAAGCDRKAPAGAKAAAPLIKVPSVLPAAAGCEWMRLGSAAWFVQPDAPTSLEERFKDRRLVVEPLGNEWYLLVRRDEEGRCDLPADARGKAEARADPDAAAVLAITVPVAARKAAADMTGRNLGRPVAVCIDGVVYTAPSMQSRVSALVQVVLPAAELERCRALADRLARGQAAVSLRAPVLVGENPDEADLRKRFREAPGRT